MDWSFSKQDDWAPSQLLSLAKHIIRNVSDFKPATTALSIHIICTNLSKLTESDALVLSQACRFLVDRLAYHIGRGEYNCVEVVDVISCFICGYSLPGAYATSLINDPIHASSFETERMSQNAFQRSLDSEEFLQLNRLLFISRSILYKTINFMISPKFIRPLADICDCCLRTQTLQLSSLDFETSDLSRHQNALTQLERLLSLNLGGLSESCVTCLFRITNALIILMCSVSIRAPTDEGTAKEINVFITALMKVFRRVTEICMTSAMAAQHYQSMTTMLVQCIIQLLDSNRSNIAYLLSTRLFGILPTTLTFVTDSSPLGLYDTLWRVSKCALDDILQISDDIPLNKSVSTDSTDDPAAGVGEWLENIFNVVPRMMDQQELTQSAKNTNIFVHSSVTLTDLCERCLSVLARANSQTNIWSPSGIQMFHDMCILCSGEKSHCISSSIISILVNLFGWAVENNLITDASREAVVNELLLPQGNSKVLKLSSAYFPLRIAAATAFAEKLAAATILKLLDYLNKGDHSTCLENSHYCLIYHLALTLPVKERENILHTTFRFLHVALKMDGNQRMRVSALVVIVSLLFNDGRYVEEKSASVSCFQSSEFERFDLGNEPDWSKVCVTLHRIGYSDYDDLYNLLVEWSYHEQWSERHLPIYAFPPPHLFFIQTKESETQVSSLCHLVRLRPMLLKQEYVNFLAAFNGEDLKTTLRNVTSIENLCQTGMAILKSLESSGLSSMNFVTYDSILALLYQLRKEKCSSEFICLLMMVTEKITRFALEKLCEKSGKANSVAAYADIIAILHNNLLKTETGILTNLHKELGEKLDNELQEWASLTPSDIFKSSSRRADIFDTLDDSYCSPTYTCTIARSTGKLVIGAVNLLHDNVLRFILRQVSDRPDDCSIVANLQWIVATHSSAMSSASVRDMCVNLFNGVQPPSLLLEQNLSFVVQRAFHSICDMSCSSPAEATPHLSCATLFSHILRDLILSTRDSQHFPWHCLDNKIVSSAFDIILEHPELDKQSTFLIIPLAQIPSTKNDALKKLFIEPLLPRCSLLVRWVRASDNPCETLCMLNPLLAALCDPQFVNSFSKTGEEDVHSMVEILIELVKSIINRDLFQKLLKQASLKAKLSDRWNHASLIFRDSRNISNVLIDTSLEDLDTFAHSLLVLINIGGAKLHCPIVEEATRFACYVIDNLSVQDFEILKGNSGFNDSQVTEIIYKLIFLADIFEYIVALGRALVSPSNIKHEMSNPSRSLTPRYSTKKQLPSSATPNISLPLCTFSATEKQFVDQHWYNCYTCNMIHGEGVCSVCAVNCHRGHDLNYSKFGSFFCDCGAKECEARKSAKYPVYFPGGAKEKQDSNISGTSRKMESEKRRRTAFFRHLTVQQYDRERIDRIMADFWKDLTLREEKLMLLISAVKQGIWLRSDQARSERIGRNIRKPISVIAQGRSLMVSCSSEIKMVFGSVNSGSRPAQNLMGVVHSADVSYVVAVQGSSRISLTSVGVLTSSLNKTMCLNRVDLENVGFKIISIDCYQDLIALCGSQQFTICRINKHGDCIEKYKKEIGKVNPNNPVIKILWVPSASLSFKVALVTSQYVRIYDPCSRNPEFTSELVLPVGNIIDVAFCRKSNGSELILVLSSVGHVYVEELDKAENNLDDNASSYFMTNTITLPGSSTAISLHYSSRTHLLFVSMTDGSFVLRLLENDDFGEAQSLPVSGPVHWWFESYGMIAAVEQTTHTKIFFFYVCDGKLFVQTEVSTTSSPSAALIAHCVFRSSDRNSFLSLQLLDDQEARFYRSNWEFEPDFWLEGAECRVLESEPQALITDEENVEPEDLITIFESCQPLENVEYHSKALQLSYDSAELKKRLTGPTTNVVCLKKKDFDITVKNIDGNSVICALRVEVTNEKCPAAVVIFGKEHPIKSGQGRIYDFPLTRKQSMTCNNEVTLLFRVTSNPSQVRRIEVYGMTKKKFGFPTASFRIEQLMTLPEKAVSFLLYVIYQLIRIHPKKEMQPFPFLDLAKQFASPCCQHNDLFRRSLNLLTVQSADYYEMKDTLLFLSLSEYKDKNKLDYTLMSVFAVQLKQILIKRTRHFHSYIRRYFCDVEAFLSFLYNQVKMHPENNDVQLEFFLLTCCAYMAAKSPKTDEIAKLIADILFIEDIVLANRCKTWLSLIVSTYCCISQRSHQILFAGPHDQFPVIAMNEMSSSTTADISKSNKAIPSAGPSFLTPAIVDELSKALWNECEAKNERNLSSGKLTPLEAFNKENEWVGRLLVYLMQQLDVTMCRGMHCIAPAQTIVSLMSQHSASQLTQVVKFLISGLDFSSLQLAQTPESERHHLMLRLIGVILAQSTGRGAVKVDNTPEESVLTGEVDVDDAASETPVEASAEEATSGTSRSVVDDDNADEEEEESEREEVLATIQNETSSSSRDATPVRNEGTLITPEDTAHATTPVVITGVVSPYAELAHQMATQLKNFGAIEYCYNILDSLYLYWKSYSNDTERTKELPLSSISPECLPDLSPLFSDRVVAPSTNVFESLKALVTEVGLKLPYQMKKVLRSELELSEKWRTLLCQYISLDSSVNRRLARKLLLLICDSDKVRYRQVRDEYSIASVIRHLKETTSGRRSLEYMELSEVIQQLKSIQNTIEHHNNVWRKICQHELTWLLDLAAKLPDIASSAVLNLILSAVRTAEEESCDDQLCCALADILLGDNETFTVLRRLIARFLMGENEARRWMIHSLLRSALQLASRPYQLKFINYLYNIVWPQAIHMGRQGAQLVDLLAYYLPRFQNRDELKRVYEEASSFIDISYDMLSARKNSVILTKLSEVVGAPDESVISGCPCLICAERDEAHEPTKLSAIKLDSRFTTSAQMIKLMGHFEISHVIIRLADIKRSKMVKRVKLYYCNKTLESAVDLKNRSDLWEKAADIKVNQEETEIDIQLPIPIVTCNLVIEMAEFYETSASGEPGNPEVVHCPRCSTSVPPNPGICSNCGENVFQCVKCRAINYDEKEPFLCNSCGFCKYARLESTIVGRSMLSVQSIEDDADRKAVETQMKALLKDIESTRCELSIVHKFMEKCCWESDPGIRPSMLLQHVTSEALTQFMASMRLDEGVSLSSLYKLAETIQGELQGQTRQLIALRSEASRYDFEVNDSMNSEVLFATGCYSSSDQCVGCISTLVVHCITLIEAICSNNSLMEEIIGESFLFSRLVVGCSLGWKISQAVQSLMWNLSETSEEATYKICTLVEQGALPAHLLSKSILSGNFRFWEQKLRCLIRMSVAGSNETSEVDLHAISALLKLCFPKASLHRFDGLSATTSAFPCAPSAGKPDQAVRTKHIFSEEEGETMTCETREAPEALFDPASLSCKEDIVESGENTAANYRNESETISSLSQTISVPSTSAIQENGMDSVMDKDNSKVLPYASFLDQLTDKADGDSIPRVVELITSHTDKSLTQHWLRGDFLWSEYDEVVAMLKKDGSEDKVDCASSAISFIRSCCKCAENKESTEDIVDQWLTHCMFSPISSVRFATYRLLIALCYRLRDDGTYELGSPIDIAHVLKKALLWLDQVRKISADSIDEYFSFLRSLIAMPGMRQILTSQPILLHIDVVRRMAIESVDLKTAETKGIAGDLSLGRHAKLFLNILKTFLSNDETGWCLLVRSCQTLLPYILRTRSNFTVISLHRTSYVEECAADLDVLIIRIAMKCPILTLRNLVKYIHMNEDDLRVQTYLVKMISSIVHPVVKKDEDFLIQLDKHQLQEDYLQGRMCGNPYKSSDSGMGPLMRDVKNKICRDCELVSLLDDDNGMELLVNQQIISLDLPVAEVYSRLWLPEHAGQPMVIVYRMRGLLGDATEPFITNFSDADHKESMDDAQLRMARLMGDCVRDFGTIISSLDTVELTGDGKKLLKELHRLLAYCVKVEKNRHLLIENKAVRRFLRVFEIVHRLGVRDADCDALALNYLELVRALLVDVLAKDEAEESAGGASFEQMSWLLELSVNGEAEGGLSGPLWESVTSLIPNLCVGNTESMDALVEIFRSCCDWEKIDTDRSFREVMTKKLDTLCVITASIYASAPGARLKNRLLKAGLIEGACHYLAANHPSLYNLSVEGPEWKQFLAKPSLKYVLRFMEGMAAHHKPSQIAIAEKSLPILHRLEQISSSEHIGTFAEDVIEALKESEEVAAQIERVRQETKAKKRQLAMAMRQKQLSKMGMAVGKKGVVKVTSRKVVNEPEVKTDSLESCCICREELGSSEKIMMVYAFASRQELKTTLNGRNFSFYSVSQLNFVHLDCHITAIRVAGSRDEWASAALHNANTKCNILVPVWSKNTKDAAMNHAVLRLISDLDAAVGFGALTLDTVTLDITELISRFVRFLSFSELSQGGGRESNLQYLCVLILLGLHVKANNPEMVMAPPQSLEHQMCACLVLESTAEWNEHRVSRIREIKNSLPRWETAKHTLMVWAVVNHFQNVILNTSGADRVSYIRENIARIIERCPAFVIEFDTALSQCGNFATFLSLNELQADFNGLDDMLD